MLKPKQMHGFLKGLLAWSLYGLFRVLPVRWCSAIGARVGRYQGEERLRIEQRVRENLHWLMPDWDDAKQIRVTREILSKAGRSYFETMVADRLVQGGHVDTTPPAHVEQILRAGQPVILVAVHLANLGDLIIASLADLLFRQYGYAVGGSPTRPIPNPWVARLSANIRNRYLSGINGRGYSPSLKTARDFFRFLARPQSVVLFHLDEAYDCQVHFPGFGRPLVTRGNLFKAIKLSAKTGAKILPVILRRTGSEPHFTLEWLPELHVGTSKARLPEDELSNYAYQLNTLFEPQVCENLVDWAQVCYLRRPAERPGSEKACGESSASVTPNLT